MSLAPKSLAPKSLAPKNLAPTTPPRPKVLTETLEHLVRGIVDHPDDVTVGPRVQRNRNPRFGSRGETLEVRVNPDDLGRVIGRAGRTATALRTVLQALSGKDNIRIDFADVDRLR